MNLRGSIVVLLLLGALCAHAGAGLECATQDAGDESFVVCRVPTPKLRLAYAAPDGSRYGTFAALRDSLAHTGRRLVFAMNAGMFHPDHRPVGLLVVDGKPIAPINRGSGTGNFYLQPNGVFMVDQAGARVLATDDYRGVSPTIATQSGPMLVHRGLIPDSRAFRAGTNSRHVRNGVCVTKPDEAVFVISDDAVTLLRFAQFFRTTLGCSEALYLDGSISSLYSTQLDRADHRADLGPMFVVAE
jgi:uncharacterized protein YigE (DUF2233 family)